MNTSTCPDCGHRWLDHPGALSVRVCASCIYEEDLDERDEAGMCCRVALGIEDEPAAHLLVARIERRRFRGDQMRLEDHSGGGWAMLRLPVGRHEAQLLLQEVEADLATMPLTQFRATYRTLM